MSLVAISPDSVKLASAEAEVAVRLANEGVPLRVIARATKIPSSELREQLHEAVFTGRLLTVPHDDWPSDIARGFSREQRALQKQRRRMLQLSSLQAVDKPMILVVVQKTFGVTAAQSEILLALVQQFMLHKNYIDITPNCLDVHVWKLRQRLTAFGLKIHTIRGCGYQLSTADRRKATDLILQHVAAVPSL